MGVGDGRELGVIGKTTVHQLGAVRRHLDVGMYIYCTDSYRKGESMIGV